MNCPSQEELSLLYDGELSGKRARQIRAHLCDCSSCAAWVRALERLSAAAGGRSPSTRCLTPEEIAELVEGVPTDELETRAQAHVETCRHCQARWSGLIAAQGALKAVAPARRRSAPGFTWGAVATAVAALLIVAIVGPWGSWRRPAPGSLKSTSVYSTWDEAEELAVPGPEEPAQLAPAEESSSLPELRESSRQQLPVRRPSLPQPGPEPPPVEAVPTVPPIEALLPDSAPPATATEAPLPGSAPPVFAAQAEAMGSEVLPPLEYPAFEAPFGGSDLVRKWREAKGDPSGFSLEELKAVYRELAPERAVLEALVARLEERVAAGANSGARQALERLRRELAALASPEQERSEPPIPTDAEVSEAGLPSG